MSRQICRISTIILLAFVILCLSMFSGGIQESVQTQHVYADSPHDKVSVDATETEEYAFHIEMTDCKHSPHNRKQTGFLVRDTDITDHILLATALHGVVDCDETKISAHNDDNTRLKNLELAWVDIGHDLAVYEIHDGRFDDTHSVIVPARSTIAELIGPLSSCGKGIPTRDISIFGYPGSDTTVRPVIGSLHQCRTLQDRTDGSGKIQSALSKRSSPVLNTIILDIAEAQIQKGHSGAPVFFNMSDGDSSILAFVGVVIGATGDSTDNGWVIPWVDLEWETSIEAEKELKALAINGIPPELKSFFVMPYEGDDPPSRFSYVRIMEETWRGQFTMSAYNINAKTCVAIYSAEIDSPNSLLLAIAPFQEKANSRENSPRKISMLPVARFGQGEHETYRRFCMDAINGAYLDAKFFAYQFPFNKDSTGCNLTNPVQWGDRKLYSSFSIQVPKRVARDTAFCADLLRD